MSRAYWWVALSWLFCSHDKPLKCAGKIKNYTSADGFARSKAETRCIYKVEFDSGHHTTYHSNKGSKISAEKTITVSKILIFVRAIYTHLMIRQSNTDTECQHKLNEVIKDILNEFYRRFGDIEAVDILAESTLLDPRFKRYGLKEEAKYLQYALME
nr:unnamed protein product [Callosobruchus analis]